MGLRFLCHNRAAAAWGEQHGAEDAPGLVSPLWADLAVGADENCVYAIAMASAAATPMAMLSSGSSLGSGGPGTCARPCEC